jgi:hypothetical protein
MIIVTKMIRSELIFELQQCCVVIHSDIQLFFVLSNKYSDSKFKINANVYPKLLELRKILFVLMSLCISSLS